MLQKSAHSIRYLKWGPLCCLCAISKFYEAEQQCFSRKQAFLRCKASSFQHLLKF